MPTPKIAKNPDLFIMAGQSNMEGCGFIKEACPPVKGAWVFDSQHRLRPAADPLHDLMGSAAEIDLELRRAATPADFRDKGDAVIAHYWRVRMRDIGAGLGLPFAKIWRKETGRQVLLVSCAHGGTSLEQWNPNQKEKGLGSLYGAMLERYRMAKALVPAAQLRGILWYQGESDASGEAAVTYGERFAHWVAAAREDLGVKNLPIFTVQIGTVADAGRNPEGWARVRCHQLEAEKKIPGVYTTSAVDLFLNDTIHIDAPGLARLGGRLARLALARWGGRSSAPTGPRPAGMLMGVGKRDMPEMKITFKGCHGGLGPDLHPAGFSALDSQGHPHPRSRVADARISPNGVVVTLRLSAPLSSGDQVAYGHGLQPVCRLVDHADMALPAFEMTVP